MVGRRLRCDRRTRADASRFVFQAPTLMPWARVAANVRLAARSRRRRAREATRDAAAALALVGLADFARHFPRELSGGMQMRASIARALAHAPDLLLMDEPFGALDEFTRQRLDAELLALWAAQRLTVVFVTHSIYEAVFLSTRVAVMGARPGRVIADMRDRRAVSAQRRVPGVDDVRARTASGSRRWSPRPAPRRHRPRRDRAMNDDDAPSRVLRYAAPALIAVALHRRVAGHSSPATTCPPYIVPSPLGRLAHARRGSRCCSPIRSASRSASRSPRSRSRPSSARSIALAVRAEPVDRDEPLSLRGAAAGHADRRDRAAHHHLGQGHARRARAVRGRRRDLSDHLQHDARPAQRRSRPAQSLPDVPREPLADPDAAAHSERAAVFLRRPAHRERPLADRRGRRRVRRGHRRSGRRARLPDPDSPACSSTYRASSRRSS